MSDFVEQGYTQLLNYGSDDVLEIEALEESEETTGSVTSTTTSDDIGSASSDALSNLTTDETASEVISGGDLLNGFTIQKDAYIKSDGVTAYNNGTGFYLGWDDTLATYVFFIGNSAANKLTWDGSTLSITGTITADSGTIGGWVITTGYIYNLQSGTPTSSPNDGVVLASGNEGIIIYEDTAKRVEVGFLSAGVYGLKGYATDGTTVLFELSDTQQVIAGWNIVDGYIYNLQSGTPTSSPNDGIVLAAGNEALIIYEDTAKRVEVGYLSAGIYGLKGYATDGTTVIFEFSDTQQLVGGFNFTETFIYELATGTPSSSPNDGLVISSGATPGVIVYEDTAKRTELGYLSAGVFGLKGYATDGTTVLFELSDTQQVISGWNIVTGYLYGLASGTPTSSPNDGIVLASGSTGGVIIYEDLAKRVEVGYLSAGIYGLKGYATDGTTTIFELSDTQQMLAGWIFTSTVLRTGSTDANSNVLIDSANSLLRLGPTTGDYITIDGANRRIRSSDYVSGVAGAGFTLEPDLLEVGNISARGLIRTAVFQKSVISAVGGSFAVIDSDKLNADMTALDASTLTISGNTTFAVNDILRIKDGTDDEWLLVTNIASAPTYTVTRDQAAVYAADTNPAWKNGASVVNYRQSGNGLIYMTASDTNAPFIAVLTHAGAPWTTLTTRARLGNLNGYLGYVADIYGLGIGSNGAGEANITIEPTNGIRIRTGTTNLFTVNMSGGATIGGWTLGSATLTGGNVTLDSGGDITVGTLNNVVRLSTTDGTYRFWIGNATAASAPFRVTPAGVVTAADINLTTAVQYQGVVSGITGTELETLSAGATSDASALHKHLKDIQVFTGNGTWTKPTGVDTVEVVCVGAGGGGGSGCHRSTDNGGGGGGGGAVTRAIFRASILGATETITVGSGGAGGAAITGTGNSDGNTGSNGTGSSFGSWLFAGAGGGGQGGLTTAGSGGGSGGSFGNASGGTGGTPNVTAANGIAGQGVDGASGASGFNAEFGGGAGGGTDVGGNAFAGGSSIFSAGGGGCGGGKDGASAGQAGAAGGTSQSYSAGGGGAGGAGGGAGGAGTAGTAGSANTTLQRGYGGSGGGGGGAGGVGAGLDGGTGGVGGLPGGGGGGGGASGNTSVASGAGGNGGAGSVFVYSY